MVKAVLLAGIDHATGKDIVEALRLAAPGLKLVAIGQRPEWCVTAAALVDHYQFVTDPRAAIFVPTLLDLCQLHDVGVVLPVSSANLAVTSRARRALESWGLRVWGPPAWTVEALTDRMQLMAFLRVNGVSAPLTIEAEEFDHQLEFPLRVCDQEALRGSLLLRRPRQLEESLEAFRLPLVQEHFEGQEYAVEAAVDQTGRLLAAVPVLCLESRQGMLIRAVTIDEPRLGRLAQTIARLMELRGPVHLRFIQEDEEFHVTEVRAGFSELLPLCGEAGVNLPGLLYDDYLGRASEEPRVECGVAVRRFWSQSFTRQAA